MSARPPVQVTGLDHLVLLVSDPEVSVQWYRDTLGLQPERLEEWRRGEVLFVSVRVDDSTVIDLLQGVPDGRNVDHVALVVQDVDLEALAVSGKVQVVVVRPACGVPGAWARACTSPIPTATRWSCAPTRVPDRGPGRHGPHHGGPTRWRNSAPSLRALEFPAPGV